MLVPGKTMLLILLSVKRRPVALNSSMEEVKLKMHRLRNL